MAKKYDLPTDKQLNYAKSLGIKVPKRATRQDVSELIDLAKGERDFSRITPAVTGHERKALISIAA